MPALPLQLRLEPHHVAAIDAVCLVTDPQSGLTVTLSRQQVIVGIIDQWMAARQAPPPESPAPPSTLDVQPEVSAASMGGPWFDQAAVKVALAERIRTLRKTKTSYPKIVALFNAEQVPTFSGKPGAKWSNSTIARLEQFRG